MAGDAPKPVSLEPDGPSAQDVSGIIIEITQRFGTRMRIPLDEHCLICKRAIARSPPVTLPALGIRSRVIRAEDLGLGMFLMLLTLRWRLHASRMAPRIYMPPERQVSLR